MILLVITIFYFFLCSNNFQVNEWQELSLKDFKEETSVVGTWNDKVDQLQKNNFDE